MKNTCNVCGDDLGLGEAFGDCNSPVACTGADVENPLGGARDEAKRQLGVENGEISLVVDAQTCLFGSIVGHEV